MFRRPAPLALALGLDLLLTGCATAQTGNTGMLTAQTPALAAAITASALPDARVRSRQPAEAAINGGLVILPAPAGARLHYHGQPVWQGLLPGRPQPMAVIGTTLDSDGEQQLGLDGDNQKGPAFQVLRQDYPEQHLTLPPTQTQYVNPDPEQLARFEREAAEQKAAYRVFTPGAADAAWPVFRWPATGRLSSPFGLRRFFNEEPRAPHLGVDIAAAAGTPAVAPADGRVALTGDYFFNGRTVIIDHGQGLYSMLCHFSEILVKPGQLLQAGDPVGLVGATGRATAPHLHWTVSLNDARIDPRWLFPQSPPQP